MISALSVERAVCVSGRLSPLLPLRIGNAHVNNACSPGAPPSLASSSSSGAPLPWPPSQARAASSLSPADRMSVKERRIRAESVSAFEECGSLVVWASGWAVGWLAARRVNESRVMIPYLQLAPQLRRLLLLVENLLRARFFLYDHAHHLQGRCSSSATRERAVSELDDE